MADHPLTSLTDAHRAEALARFARLRPHVEDGVPLSRLAHAHGIPLRTLQGPKVAKAQISAKSSASRIGTPYSEHCGCRGVCGRH